MKNKRGFWTVFIIFILAAVTYAAASPTVTINASPEQGTVPLEITFSALSDVPLTDYAWDLNNDGKIDSTEPTATMTYTKGGSYTILLQATSEGNESESVEATKNISLQEAIPISAITISLTANPSSGTAPLTVQFTAAAAGEEPLTYAWDFTSDGKYDSTQQSPTTTYDLAGVHQATVKVTDAVGNTGEKSVPVTVTSFEAKVNVTSYFPTTLIKGEQQVTLIITNDGDQTLRDITAKVIGKGIQHLSSSSIGSLKAQDQDSLTVKMNILETGTISGIVKVADKSFPIEFTVAKEILYNKTEIQQQYAILKKQLDEQEQVYTDKKAEGFLVEEIFDSIKETKKQLQDVQQQLLTNSLSSAKLNVDLAASGIEDIAKGLSLAQKEKVTALQWIKENAVAIAAIIASLGAISGFIVKLHHSAKKVTETVGVHAKKVGENMKEHLSKKKTIVDAQQPTAKEAKNDPQPTSMPDEELSEKADKPDEEKEN